MGILVSQPPSDRKEDAETLGSASELGLGSPLPGGPRTCSLVFWSLGVTSFLANFLCLHGETSSHQRSITSAPGRFLSNLLVDRISQRWWVGAWVTLTSQLVSLRGASGQDGGWLLRGRLTKTDVVGVRKLGKKQAVHLQVVSSSGQGSLRIGFLVCKMGIIRTASRFFWELNKWHRYST